MLPFPFTLNCSDWHRASNLRRTRGVRFRVSFVGSANGLTRNLMRIAVNQFLKSSDIDNSSVAFHFTVNDEERRRMAEDPEVVLSSLFGKAYNSFNKLLRHSMFCLVLPGDVSDITYRFFEALAVGCTPVIIGGPSQTVSLPFADVLSYDRFAITKTIHSVTDAVSLLRSLYVEHPLRPEIVDVQGLFMRHVDCECSSGDPFLSLFARALRWRADVLSRLRWRV
eukprot:TRINITY_DN52130_c0_g1_i1.p1 TRINITY_DN52130_c0_g1~~TRINITY_DN52130_c0_g1_i1.p1  ORF type:complete len:224 (-),score=11.48 TRINITY_DN52130_c0_g1_i1:114-785(-)